MKLKNKSPWVILTPDIEIVRSEYDILLKSNGQGGGRNPNLIRKECWPNKDGDFVSTYAFSGEGIFKRKDIKAIKIRHEELMPEWTLV